MGSVDRGNVESQTPRTSNTGGSNLQNQVIHAVAACDYLTLHLYGQWSEWDQVREFLERGRSAAVHGSESRFFVAGQHTACEFQPHGAGKATYHCPYVFSGGGILVGIADRWEGHQKEQGSGPCVRVEIRSEVFLQLGLADALALAYPLIESVGRFEILGDEVSRVDLCCDLVGVDVAELVKRRGDGRMICRARKWSVIGRGPRTETVSIGLGSPCMVRMYDKLRESVRNPLKWELMLARWGGEVPQAATRVEFQLRRRALIQNHDINTVQDLIAKLRSLTDYLTGEWLRFTAHRVQGRNHARAGMWSVWSDLRQAFRSFSGRLREERSRRPRVLPEAKRLIAQAVGCITTAMAVEGVVPDSHQEFLAYVMDELQEGSSRGVFAVREKAVSLRARTGAVFGERAAAVGEAAA